MYIIVSESVMHINEYRTTMMCNTSSRTLAIMRLAASAYGKVASFPFSYEKKNDPEGLKNR